MVTFKSRLTGLIESLEAGNDLTPQQRSQASQLQALDIAAIGDAFAADAMTRDNLFTENFRQVIDPQ